ncbi:Peptidase family M23 [Anaerovirgula multivorans]|uniref:Peptidase family M23 n=1 Tax=Anaerovirgula multivorans TaxID=312168 RepID=A0A239CNW1_9FIRM|nr:M23 family metallopeptidase [Anaerovirgula multivorans]SNS21830.1 Peptidase family M23 [Anaerovirgula multivorans]
MQLITDEFKKLIRNRLKAGSQARPRCVVEVDRLSYVPGRVETLDFTTFDIQEIKKVQQRWIASDGSGDFDGTTQLQGASAVFPIHGHTHETATKTSGYKTSSRPSHTGVDYVLASGTFKAPLVAVWAGKVKKVVYSNSTTGYGNYIDILHPNGLLSRYAHLNTVSVTTGQEVSAGAIIGTLGNTGNVRSKGKVPSAAERAAGAGAHLHFEVHKSINNTYVTVNPEPYLVGSAKAYKSVQNVGGGASVGEEIEGYPGELRLYETFATRNWHTLSRYAIDTNFNDLVTYETITNRERGNWLTYTFGFKQLQQKITTGFNITLNMLNAGFMNLVVRSDFKYAEGDRFRVFVGNSNDASVNLGTFEGLDNIQELKDIYVPRGEVTIRIEVVFGGKHDALPTNYAPRFGTKKLSIGYIEVQELGSMSVSRNKTAEQLDPTSGGSTIQQGYWVEEEIDDIMFNKVSNKMDIVVGDFVYMDTRTLDNVTSVSVNNSLDQETAGASVTITNENGSYSPTHSPFYFPELNLKSVFTYWAGNYLIGVLSNNTPIRIYLGYGSHLVRVFTGLIDRTDEVGEGVSLTVTARDMYKKAVDKVLTEDKNYPDVNFLEDDTPDFEILDIEKVAWLKSAVIHDLIAHAGLIGWRVVADDLRYPDAVIEESYIIQINEKAGTVLKAVPGEEGQFEAVPIDSIPTPQGWKNPYVEAYGRSFDQFSARVSDCIVEVLKDTNYRAYCDRYGTFRLEPIRFNNPVVESVDCTENLMSISKNTDYSRVRSHIIIVGSDGKPQSFVDKELLMELKGEVRTAVVQLDWADTLEMKRQVAQRLFLDMKRVARTLQVRIPGNPALDVLDRIDVTDRNTSTYATYTIKGIQDAYDAESGEYTQTLDLFWAGEDVIV